PQHLASRRLPEHALRGQQGDSVDGKVETKLRAEYRSRTDSRPVRAFVALIPDAPHQVEILPFPVCFLGTHDGVRYHPKSPLASPWPPSYRAASASPRMTQADWAAGAGRGVAQP